jgi:hypothetical protein
VKCPACDSDNDDVSDVCFQCGKVFLALTRGSILGGRYEILDLLGRGGMGMVYRGHDRMLDEDVAIKVLRRDLTGAPEMAARFLSEIKLARRVSHPNVCRIHEYGEDAGLSYISMALLEGRDLKQILSSNQEGLPMDEAFDVAIQVAEGLGAIHEAGIIHRDLKTPNLMRDEQGVVRLMDFGIAKDAAATARGGLTGTGMAVGTPEYMSPEQCRGEMVDLRSDLYSLGILIFEIFTGHVPFRGDSLLATLFMQIQEPPPLEGEARLPPALVPILRKALAKTPKGRYSTAAEMAQALEEARTDPQRVPMEATPQPAAAEPAPAPAPRPAEPSALPARAEAPAPPPPPTAPDPAPRPFGRDRRSETRLETPLTVVVKRLAPGGATLQEERTIADNLSRGGARVRRLTISGFKVGDVVGFEEVGGDFRTRATVRNAYVGPDRIPRLGLQFLDSKAPDRLVMTGDWKPSVLRSPAVRPAPVPQPSATQPPATAPAAAAPPAPGAAQRPMPPLAPLVSTGATDPRLRAANGAMTLDERRRGIIAKHEEMRRQTHYELLGLLATAGKGEIQEAYQRLIRRYHPDTGNDPQLADIRSQMHAISVALTEAADVLSDPRRRAAYDAELSARRPVTVFVRAPSVAAVPDPEVQVAEAERALVAGRQLVAGSKYWEAIQVLEQALPRSEPRSRLRHAVQVQLATAYMANPKWLKRAEEMLQQVVTESPSFTEAYFALGRLYKQKGLKVRAERMFRKVLELDPKSASAASELASVS